MNTLLIKNCIIQDNLTDVLIKDGKISAIGNISEEYPTAIDASGATLLPAFVDIHTHLREPGYEYKEDITSGSQAAVHGGFASICCMPNTLPICDNVAIVRYIIQRGQEVGLARIYPIGAITKGEQGTELAEIGKMKNAGAVAISDDGKPVPTANIMRQALLYAGDFNIPVLSHCEDKSLSEGGCVNEGYFSMMTGLKGITPASEEIMVAREILLAETYNRPIHLCHISTIGSVRMVREAKSRGVKVTAETCPHYFAGTESMVENFDSNTKVNPPLRTSKDVEAIIEGLCDGTIDCIATDHAPHHNDEKQIEYQLAAFGISGLETAFALAYTNLVASGKLSLNKLTGLMTTAPAQILNLPYGTLEVGGTADLVLCDLATEYKLDKSTFVSKGKNTPFDGFKVQGKVICTIVGGDIKYKEKN